MKEKITDLLESIVEEKPVDTKDVFEQVMLEKIRQVVSEYEPEVASSLFADEEEVDEIEEEVDEIEEERTVGGMSDLDLIHKEYKGKLVKHAGGVHKVMDVLPKGREMTKPDGSKVKLAKHQLRLDRGKGTWPLDIDVDKVKLHKGD